jgi:hypothetical protein
VILRVGVLAALVAVALAGCGGKKSATCEPRAGAGTQLRSSDAMGESIGYLTAVRVETEDCVDRVTFDFRRGAGSPGFHAEYLPASQALVQDGSGARVPVDGSAFLVVRITPAATAEPKGDGLHFTYTGPKRIRVDDGRSLREVVKTGDFEAQLTWVLGLEARRPFTADASSPSRLVIEVG